MNPLISVIVPVYNAEAYLHRCVDSLLAQTFRDFEILLIDDGSPDKSGDICDLYAQQDDRIRVFHKKIEESECMAIGYRTSQRRVQHSLRSRRLGRAKYVGRAL